jgi:hypothetical protein
VGVAEKASARSATPRRASTTAYAGPNQWLVLAVAWLVPGAGHLWLGRRQKGLTFLVVLPFMFVFGLALQGRLFPFAPSEPLVALAAIADVGVGLPNLIARGLGYGAGQVIAITWEYGNTFTIVAGLLNMLVVLDAFDVMEGRK